MPCPRDTKMKSARQLTFRYPLRALLTATLAMAIVPSCEQAPLAPSQKGTLHMTAQVNRTAIESGGTAKVTYRLENQTSQAVSLQFSTTCQIMPYIAFRATGDPAYPPGGNWVCSQMTTELTVQPGGTVVREIQLRAAGAAPYPYVALPPGEYVTYARLDDVKYKLQSDAVHFLVQ
jgi:hypothetical protein